MTGEAGVAGSQSRRDTPLESLGLTPAAIRAYRTLVALREAEPDELRHRAGLTIDEAEESVAALTALGLVTTSTSGPVRLVAAPPDVAGEGLLLKRMQELQAARMEFVQLADAYRAALPTGTIDEFIEVVPRSAVPQLNDHLNSQAQDEVMWVNAQPSLAPVTTFVKELDRLEEGIRYRVIYARSLLGEPGMLDVIRRDIKAGEQARVIDEVPLKMGIVDRRVALLPLYTEAPSGFPGWLLVHRCALLDALVALFETMWLSALPLDGVVGLPVGAAGAGRDSGDKDLAAEDIRLLTLLLAGMTDDAIARQLGIGKRTVVRRVAQLMSRAGVSTRMQLGWKASQLGWVAEPGTGSATRLPDAD
jgi:DNA-binding CsgD family transcriptional regulator